MRTGNRDDKTVSLDRRFASGVGWALTGSVLSQGAVFLGSIIAARLLGKELFGVLAVVQSTALASANMASLGLGVLATRYVSAYRTKDPARAGRILAFCSLTSTFVGVPFAFAPFLLTGLLPQLALAAPGAAKLLWLAAIYVYFTTLNGFQLGALTGLEAFRKLAVINLRQAVISLVLTILLTFALGVQGAVLSLAVSAVVLWLAQHLALRQECSRQRIRIDYRDAFAERSILAGFVLPCTLSSVLANGAIWAGNLLVAHGPLGLKEMGIFQAAYVFRSLVVFVPAQVTRVASPMLTNLWGANETARYGKLFWSNLKISAIAAAATACLLWLAGPYVMRLFGREFSGGGLILATLAAAAVVEVVASSLYQVLLSHNRMWLQVMTAAVWSVALVSVVWAADNRAGALSLSFGYLAAWASSLILYWAIAVRLFSVKPTPAMAACSTA